MWNTLVTWSPYDILSAADLVNNFDNVQTLISSLPYHADGRLTLTTGTPITTADVSGASTLYYTPIGKGSLLSLYDGSSAWNVFSFTEKSLSLSGYIKGACYDIFAYSSSGVPALESAIWKKVTASNSPTAGASKTINLSDTVGLAIGMDVTVKDGANSEVTPITAVVSNTSITVSALSNSYTTPDVYGYPTRATGLTTVNGVYVKSGSTTRRYLGTIRINSTGGQTDDSKTSRFVWNYYNRAERYLFCTDSTASWTYATASWQAANASVVNGVGRVGLVVGLAEDLIKCSHLGLADSAVSGRGLAVGVGVNSITTNSAPMFGGTASATSEKPTVAEYVGYPSIGYTYLQRLEYAPGGSVTFYGGTTAKSNGMYATVMG